MSNQNEFHGAAVYRPEAGTAREGSLLIYPQRLVRNTVLATPIVTRFQSRDMYPSDIYCIFATPMNLREKPSYILFWKSCRGVNGG